MAKNSRDNMTSSTRNLDAFCTELTRLCNQHGIGIEGGTPYEMEQDDYLFRYTVDSGGKLVRV